MTYKTTNEWLKAAPRWGPSTDAVRKSAVCASGLVLSIQASRWHQCSPKQDNASAYSTVEVGFPEKHGKPARLRTLGPRVSRFRPIYVFVPVETLDRLLRRNGGIVRAFYE